MRGDALILMGKAPVPGLVKTRMRPLLGYRRAASLYSCMLADAALEASALRGVKLYLFHDPPEGKRHFLSGPFARFRLLPQEGADLGERMAGAMKEAFSAGAESAVVIGADCPALSAGRMREAFQELAGGTDAVFGPAMDGGFYLAGFNAPTPSVFSGIEWGTRGVLEQTLARCRDAGMTYALLPPEADVDTPEDLPRLRSWARAHRRPACTLTRKWLGNAMTRADITPSTSSRIRRAGV